MAPKVCVPADFGRHHIGSPSHGNLTFNLKEGAPIKANSIILSLNSPVIDNLTTDLQLTSLDVEDFSREAVDCFIEASYTGEVEAVNLDNFRDVNKMSHVFQVSWLSARCEEYFVSYLDKLDNESSYPDILFAVEEAVYLMSALKKRDFLDFVIKKLNSIPASKRNTFISHLLSDLGAISKIKIDVCIAIVKCDVHVLVELLISHLEKQGLNCLDENSRHILQNVNLNICYTTRNDVHAKLFSALEDLENCCKEDFKLCIQLLKQSTSKRLNSAIPVSLLSLQEHWLISCSASMEKMAISEHVSNLYLFFDGLYTKMRQADKSLQDLKICSSLLDQIIAVKESRGWTKMSYEYVHKIYSSTLASSQLAELVENSDELVTKESDVTCTTICEFLSSEFAQKFFKEDQDIRFKVLDPEYSKQMFLFSTNALKGKDPETLSMRWNRVEADSTEHSTTDTVPRLHFVLEKELAGNISLLPISWCGMPSFDETMKFWNWGYIRFHSEKIEEDGYAIVGSGGMASKYFDHSIADTARCRLVAYVVK